MSSQAPESACWVYFVEAEGTGLVKIGSAVNVHRRLAEISSGCPVPLKVLAVAQGSRTREAELHALLLPYRSKGEWFRKSPAMEAVIAALDAPADMEGLGPKRFRYMTDYVDDLVAERFAKMKAAGQCICIRCGRRQEEPQPDEAPF